MSVIECQDLSKWYGDVVGLNDVTVEIEEGITGLLGPNGAGKSTFLKLAVGLLRPSSGRIEVLGQEPWDNTELLERIGFLPEGPPPWRGMPAIEAATIAGRFSGMERDDSRAAAEDALDTVGLGDELDKKVEAYSRGMQQRFKLALVLMHDPELLILDEPLLGCDPVARRDLIQLINEMADDDDKSMLVSTHVLPDMEAMTERMLLLHQGRQYAHGRVSEIRDLLEQYPRSVRITTPDPSGLAPELLEWETVMSVEKEEGAVLVRTEEPTEFFEQLQAAFVEDEVEFTSIEQTDDDVEAVFQYLVGDR